jgi:hypothetical protein
VVRVFTCVEAHVEALVPSTKGFVTGTNAGFSVVGRHGATAFACLGSENKIIGTIIKTITRKEIIF